MMTPLFNISRKPRFGIALLIVVAFQLTISSELVAQRPDPDAPAPVVVDTALLKSQSNRQRFVGTLSPIRSSTVGSAVEGRIVEMVIDEGDLVGFDSDNDSDSTERKAGDTQTADNHNDNNVGENENKLPKPVIARIESDALDIQIEAAKIELQSRMQTLDELKLTLPADISLAEANVAQANAQLEYDQNTYERQKNLAGRGGGLSDREVAEARSVYLTQQQVLTAAEAALRKLTITKQIKLEIAETVIQAQNKELARLAEQLSRHAIVAPFEGAVVSKMADIGDWVSRGSPIAKIVQLNPIELNIQVPQKFLPQLQDSIDQARKENPSSGTGTQTQSFPVAEIQIEGFDEPLFGDVVAIVPQADLRTRSFPVMIRVSNPRTESGYALKPGMLATASLNVGRDRDVILIKKDALILGDENTTVIIASPNDSNPTEFVAKPVVVTIGQSFDDSIEVLTGVSAGDKVVVQGNERVRPGQKLKILK